MPDNFRTEFDVLTVPCSIITRRWFPGRGITRKKQKLDHDSPTTLQSFLNLSHETDQVKHERLHETFNTLSGQGRVDCLKRSRWWKGEQCYFHELRSKPKCLLRWEKLLTLLCWVLHGNEKGCPSMHTVCYPLFFLRTWIWKLKPLQTIFEHRTYLLS